MDLSVLETILSVSGSDRPRIPGPKAANSLCGSPCPSLCWHLWPKQWPPFLRQDGLRTRVFIKISEFVIFSHENPKNSPIIIIIVKTVLYYSTLFGWVGTCPRDCFIQLGDRRTKMRHVQNHVTGKLYDSFSMASFELGGFAGLCKFLDHYKS